jgi:hypothetical protein
MANSFRALLDRLAKLAQPKQHLTSKGLLDKWVIAARNEVNQAEDVSVDEARLGWLVASAVVVATMQRARNDDGDALFLLKGGSYLQYRLGLATRPTKDIDGLVRGELEPFLDRLDHVLDEPWGELTFDRGPVEIIDVPGMVIKPRRFEVRLQVRGVTWRKVRVELSPDEADIGSEADALPGPRLHGFRLPDPDGLFGITLRSQIAQKLHASTDPHQPPDFKNDRARDLVDLILLRRTAEQEGAPSLADIRASVGKVFASRAEEARGDGRDPRNWPSLAVAHEHWAGDYASAAQRCGVEFTLAVDYINSWIEDIDQATNAHRE